jgi:Spy/CpxP family protein refolding chaperone
LKITLSLVAIFLAGAVAGAFVGFKVAHQSMSNPPSQEQMAARWCAELKCKLALTPEQLQKIRPIVEETMAEIKTSVGDRMSCSLSNSSSRIACVLTPEQRVKFEKMMKECQSSTQKKFREKREGAAKSE